jgi:hypothetical protein
MHAVCFILALLFNDALNSLNHTAWNDNMITQ